MSGYKNGYGQNQERTVVSLCAVASTSKTIAKISFLLMWKYVKIWAKSNPHAQKLQLNEFEPGHVSDLHGLDFCSNTDGRIVILIIML